MTLIARISYLDTFGLQPQSLLFRASPGQIYSIDKPYSYAIIEFTGKPFDYKQSSGLDINAQDIAYQWYWQIGRIVQSFCGKNRQNQDLLRIINIGSCSFSLSYDAI